jgi:hypothetical protein
MSRHNPGEPGGIGVRARPRCLKERRPRGSTSIPIGVDRPGMEGDFRNRLARKVSGRGGLPRGEIRGDSMCQMLFLSGRPANRYFSGQAGGREAL